MSENWETIPHGSIEKLSARVWRVQGDLPRGPLKRVMTIAKRADGSLLIHSAIAMSEAAMKELDAIGKVGIIIVPNGFHRIDAKRFHERYPDAKVYCPKGSEKRVREVVEVDGTYEGIEKDEHVSMEYVRGTNEQEGALIVRDDKDTTLVLNDVLFNMPHAPGFTGFVMKHVLDSSGGPRISRLSRVFLVKDKPALAAHLEELAGLENLKRVLFSHHEVVTDQPGDMLRAVAKTLS